MMGGGSLEGKCRELITDRGLGEIIELTGFINNPYPILNNSKVLVMTSKSEGLPMVAIEALLLGKPVIVPQLAGIENIIDSACGYICKEDKEFSDNIITLLKSNKNYLEMSLAATKKVETICNMDIYKDQIKQVYNGVN
jgi:glycosyltransferase involved in cell wall biosynthesis